MAGERGATRRSAATRRAALGARRGRRRALAAVPDRLAAWPPARERPARARRRRRADRGARAAREEPRAGPRAEGLRDVLAPLVRPAIPTARCACRTSISSWPPPTRRRDPRHFVAELVLDPPQSSADLAQPPHLDEDYLTLSTIHSAKGLEWDSVHVLAVYDGNFPACMAAGTSEEIDEERRLLYVGHDPRAPHAARSTCRSATTTARTAATTRTATASRRAS